MVKWEGEVVALGKRVTLRICTLKSRRAHPGGDRDMWRTAGSKIGTVIFGETSPEAITYRKRAVDNTREFDNSSATPLHLASSATACDRHTRSSSSYTVSEPESATTISRNSV
jgi:hypothetical protein